jgi:ATP-binding cassette, subfamily B, bacterial PglK
MNTYHKALSFLTPRERKQGLLLGAVIILMALFELVGVASIVPFLGLLANPALIETNPILNSIYTVIGVSSVSQLLFLIGIGSFILMMMAAAIRTVGRYALTRFTQMRHHSIAARLMEAYLRQPYEFYLNRHTGDMAKGILSEVDQVVNYVFQPAANLLSQGMTLLAMIFLLIFIDPYVAFFVGLVLGTMYAIIFLVIRKYLTRSTWSVSPAPGRLITLS